MDHTLHALNAALGLFLIGWMLLTLPWVLSGAEPPVPGSEIAFVSACIWVGWNSQRLLKEE